jgi:hypothetical protein
MLALGIKIIRNAETEIRNAEVEKVFGKAGLSPTVSPPAFSTWANSIMSANKASALGKFSNLST